MGLETWVVWKSSVLHLCYITMHVTNFCWFFAQYNRRTLNISAKQDKFRKHDPNSSWLPSFNVTKSTMVHKSMSTCGQPKVLFTIIVILKYRCRGRRFMHDYSWNSSLCSTSFWGHMVLLLILEVKFIF